jgi:MFS family permease
MLQKLLRHNTFLILWCIIAAFGTYFCTYAFRKPFNAGTYSDYALWSVGYKSILILSQMAGYVLSKYIGIKLISELQPARRIITIVGLIGFSELALIGLGLCPHPWNFVFMFFNGLPLGLIFGIIFSYLEGRRFTEMLSIGLGISMIMGSGMLKSLYFFFRDFFVLTEFWVPAVIGLISIPFLALFVWMLSQIPKPTESDMTMRVERLPMVRSEKLQLLSSFGVGIFCMVAINALSTVCRDFRDNFMVELTREVGINSPMNIFYKVELLISVVVLLSIGIFSFIKNNARSFAWMHVLILFGLITLGASALMYSSGLISGLTWLIMSGMGIFLSYIPTQSIYFDRFIATFRVKANAGFLIYLCDSAGYTCSMGILIYKELFSPNLSWLRVVLTMNITISIISIILLMTACYYFYKKKYEYL